MYIVKRKAVPVIRKSPESILDMLQGMWDNLKLAEKNHYCRLYALTFQRMNKESLCEIEYALNNLDTEKKLFLLLLQINASIKWDLIRTIPNAF